MKEEVLNKFVETMIGMLQDASAFAKHEIPEVCKEIILYGRVKEAVTAVLGLAALIVAIRKAPGYFKKWSDAGSYEGEEWCVAGVVTSIVGIFGAGFFIDGGMDSILAWTAPRLYLLEYFKHLLK